MSNRPMVTGTPLPGPRRPVNPPDFAKVDQDFRLSLYQKDLPEAEVDQLARAHNKRFGYDDKTGELLTEQLDGNIGRGPRGVDALAHGIYEARELLKHGEPPAAMLERALRTVAAPPEVMEAARGIVVREEDGRIMYRRPGLPPVRGGPEVIHRVVSDLMAQRRQDELVDPASLQAVRERMGDSI